MIDFVELRKMINKRPKARFRLERARSKAYSTTQVMTGMPRGSSDGDGMLNNVERLMNEEESYKALCENISDMQAELEPLIEKLTDPLERTVMYERYIKSHSVISIGISLEFSREYIHRVINRAEKNINNRLHRSH